MNIRELSQTHYQHLNFYASYIFPHLHKAMEEAGLIGFTQLCTKGSVYFCLLQEMEWIDAEGNLTVKGEEARLKGHDKGIELFDMILDT